MTPERTGIDELSRPTWLVVLACVVLIAMSVAAARLSLRRPINGDDAYNLQIATSIGTNFCYCTRYLPARVFPVEESTNGPMQYVAGFFVATTHNPDRVAADTIAVGMLLLGVALLVLDPWLVFLAGLLFLAWYGFVYVAINTIGEVWAIAFCVLGIAALRRCDLTAPLRTLVSRRMTLFAVLAFALATESKLLAVIVWVPVTWAFAYEQLAAQPLKSRLIRASTVTATVLAYGACLLFLLIGFSVTHSLRAFDLSAMWQAFSGFLLNMLGQGEGQAMPITLQVFATTIATFSSPVVAVLSFLAAAILLYANRGYAIFVLATFGWWLHYGVNERHVVISLFVLVLLGGYEAHRLLARAARAGAFTGAGRTRAAIALGVLVLATAGAALSGGLEAPARVTIIPGRTHIVGTSVGRISYGRGLMNALRSRRYVVTSGWFQFADLTLREHLEFYDRTNPKNANLPRDQVALFFDRGNHDWPLTTVRGNCGRILYMKGPLVVCVPKRTEPLAFQP